MSIEMEDALGAGGDAFDEASRFKTVLSRIGDIVSLQPASAFSEFEALKRDRSFHPTLNLLETLLSHGENTEPRAVMSLVNAYVSANQQDIGEPFFAKLLELYGERMPNDLRAVYLVGYSIIRATLAGRIPIWRRIAWVKATFRHLEEARLLTGGQHPLVRWAAGVIYAQVPGFFGKKRQAFEDLNWLLAHPETAPNFGFYREAHRLLSRLHAADGDENAAELHRRLSGFGDQDPKALFTGWFTSGPEGTTMSPEPTLREIVPGRVFALFGFGFSDIYFVLSEDGRELFAVDAGTQPHSLQAAHELLLSHYPSLPNVTAAFITHAHWDHIGGHSYLRAQNPDIRFYGRSSYRPVVERVLRQHSYHFFRGGDFRPEWVGDYRPDVEIERDAHVTIGGTRIEFLPVDGGETEDAMLVHFPELGVVFVGDIVMPWYGEPWVEEGSLDGAVQAMDRALSLNAEHMLHGHHPLTLLYGSEVMAVFRDAFVWLRRATTHYLRRGFSAKDVIRENLIPPGLERHSAAYLAYAAARDNVIARMADRWTGIWREDRTGQEPEGLDQITAEEHGRMLERYLSLTAGASAKMLRKMLDEGDNELALRFAVAAERRFGADDRIIDAKQEAADRLRSAAQFTDPFRFVTYTELSGRTHGPMTAP